MAKPRNGWRSAPALMLTLLALISGAACEDRRPIAVSPTSAEQSASPQSPASPAAPPPQEQLNAVEEWLGSEGFNCADGVTDPGTAAVVVVCSLRESGDGLGSGHTYLLASDRGLEAFAFVATPVAPGLHPPSEAESRAEEYEQMFEAVGQGLADRFLPPEEARDFTARAGLRFTDWGRSGFVAGALETAAEYEFKRAGVWIGTRRDAPKLSPGLVMLPDADARAAAVGEAIGDDDCRLFPSCQGSVGDDEVTVDGTSEYDSSTQLLVAPQEDISFSAAGDVPGRLHPAVRGALAPDIREDSDLAVARLLNGKYGIDRRFAGALEIRGEVDKIIYRSVEEYWSPPLLPADDTVATAREFYEVYTDDELTREEWEERLTPLFEDGYPVSELKRVPDGDWSEIGFGEVDLSTGEQVWEYMFSGREFDAMLYIRNGKITDIA